MSFPIPTITPGLRETVLAPLALQLLPGTNGDEQVARDIARVILDGYHAQTDAELRLAAEVVTFSLNAMHVLGQAAIPGQSMKTAMRLRGSAVSLSRQSHRSQRALDTLRRTANAKPEPFQAEPVHHTTPPPTPPAPAPTAQNTPAPAAQTAPAPAPQTARSPAPQKPPAKPGKYGGLTYTQLLQKRMTAARLAEKERRQAAIHPGPSPAISAAAAQPAPQ